MIHSMVHFVKDIIPFCKSCNIPFSIISHFLLKIFIFNLWHINSLSISIMFHTITYDYMTNILIRVKYVYVKESLILHGSNATSHGVTNKRNHHWYAKASPHPSSFIPHHHIHPSYLGPQMYTMAKKAAQKGGDHTKIDHNSLSLPMDKTVCPPSSKYKQF